MVPLVAGGLAALAFLIAPLVFWQTALGVLSALTISAPGLRSFQLEPIVDLAISRNGRVRYREMRRAGPPSVWFQGRLALRSWERRHIAVIGVDLPWGRVHCPIWRHLQRPGEYRRLRVWLKHRKLDFPG